jgi:hypothetical protein
MRLTSGISSQWSGLASTKEVFGVSTPQSFGTTVTADCVGRCIYLVPAGMRSGGDESYSMC